MSTNNTSKNSSSNCNSNSGFSNLFGPSNKSKSSNDEENKKSIEKS